MVFLIAFGGLAFGGALILLMARYAPHPAANRRATERALPGREAMPLDEFRALVIDLLEALRLEIVLITAHGGNLDIIARSSEPLTSGRYLVHAIGEAPGDVVDQPYIVKLQDDARADAVAKGILMTPYTILTDGLGNLEMPIELIDGEALRALVERYLDAKRLDALAKYRGFGFDPGDRPAA
jgi:hypothetical protein